MSEAHPFFSIIMPTRNRANLLRFALQSALHQSYDNFEIVLSDNYSSDETPEIVKQVAGERVRYFRTNRVLPMHDNWEFALDQATGDWIIFLCDDDALFPDALETIAGIIRGFETQLLCWPWWLYFLDTHYRTERRGQVAVLRTSRSVRRVSSRSQLSALFGLKDVVFPRMLNSCSHRKLVDKSRKRLGRLFLPPAPDYAAGTALLANVDEYVLIDDPLSILGTGSHVGGVSSVSGVLTDHLHFVDDFQGRAIFDRIPPNCALACATSTQVIVQSLLTVQAAMPGLLSGLSIDWAEYFSRCYDDLVLLTESGLNTRSVARQFFARLNKQSAGTRARVYRSLVRATAKSLLKSAIYRLGMLRFIDCTVGRRRRDIVGWDGAFSNIFEAVTTLSPRRGSAQTLLESA